MELDKIYNMDCLEGMKQIPDGSVDLIATDTTYEREIENEVENKEETDKLPF